MKETFRTYTNSKGETILYRGEANLEKLEALSLGPGDLWHSSFEEGYKNAFSEIIYQTAVFFWYGLDFDNLDECVSWRMSPNNFAIRERVWNHFSGFDSDYESEAMQALDYAYNLLRNGGAIPMYVKELYSNLSEERINIGVRDRYIFFRKNFKSVHSVYMLWRQGIGKWSEWNAFSDVKKHVQQRKATPKLPPRTLERLRGNPTVSYIIPTMFRQEYTLQLLEDLKKQSYLPAQVIVVDATPPDSRDAHVYNASKYPFEVQFYWQETKGSCRARNEAINNCRGDYIVFGDDDIRIPENFIENHIRLLQTYGAGACNGLDIRADHHQQTLENLTEKLAAIDQERWYVGASNNFSNANSCVRREWVHALEGNDINYDGGYGEDSDFGISLTKIGVAVLHNPFSVNLHLKPPAGGYRFWGSQAKLTGKKRKAQPWELDSPVGIIRPVPSPTIMYQLYKQFSKAQRVEYKRKYFLRYLLNGSKVALPLRLLRLPYRWMQYRKSVWYAKQLLKLGKRTA